jgi:phosphonate metabolism protein PhnN/1,5-bisphosphokinase (PRPP-forming)
MLQRPIQLTPGMLVLVVGPSGAGKDALISASREKLSPDARFAFVKRATTRTGSHDGELQDVVTPERFSTMEAGGEFLLSWQAHGLAYGIPVTASRDIAQGRVVIANVSRTVITTAATIAANLAVINVTAPVEVLAERLARRGREPVDDVAARLRRTVELPIIMGPVLEVCNDGALQTAADKFTAHLIALADQLRA